MNTEIEQYALSLVTSECGELLAAIGRAGRFGLDTPPTKDFPIFEKDRILEEMGDVLAAIEYYALRCGSIGDYYRICGYAAAKGKKLLDPNSKDNLGRRLAP